MRASNFLQRWILSSLTVKLPAIACYKLPIRFCCGSLRNAASIIVAFDRAVRSDLDKHFTLQLYGTRVSEETQNFDIIMLQRPENYSSFKGKIVFPGGLVSSADFSRALWTDLLYKTTAGTQQLLTSPPMFSNLLRMFPSHNETSEYLNPAVGLRLCALRELFEETGLLLVAEQIPDDCAYTKVVVLNSVLLESWQKNVLQDPKRFSQLYRELGFYPPLSALKEWSNWLTPVQHTTRFDTLFFFVTINSVIVFDGTDAIKTTRWQNDEAQRLYADAPVAFLPAERRWFIPPQVYELGRLAQFPDISKLISFAAERARLGCRRWTPVVSEVTIIGQKCSVVFLPGDQRYEEAVGRSDVKFTASDLAQDTERNRLLFSPDSTEVWVDTNVYELGHVSPLSRAEYLRNCNRFTPSYPSP
ncbi:Nucleoside diphosphate-linked moiety X motif 19, mitochondrial [Clonorchis sinensis]|uniref:Nucleoside diphosphate-linked moiety X motif 19, mitochondrial n=1 Tax=Clonorchis sinensis TaxID=79923 RepID=A0A3R7CJH7_CLOSI|nr:Nucleoside diphosphate-linked moiety X motif 19, mitochondrial [Clonorchis sinensis]